MNLATLHKLRAAQGVAPAGKLLTLYPSAQVAYSLRQLGATFGDVVRVRRSSDNVEADFNPTEITDGTLTTWTGANDGFVTTWYDQSGNANNATQTTAGTQPRLVNSGTVVTKNSLPTIEFTEDIIKALNITTSFSSITVGEVFTTIAKITDPPTGLNVGGISYGAWSAPRSHYPYSDNNIYDNFGSTARKTVGNPAASLANLSLYNILSKSGEWTARLDSVELFTTATNTVEFRPNVIIGDTVTFLGANISEIVLYPADKTTDRAGIKSNIDTYYSL